MSRFEQKTEEVFWDVLALGVIIVGAVFVYVWDETLRVKAMWRRVHARKES